MIAKTAEDLEKDKEIHQAVLDTLAEEDDEEWKSEYIKY